MVINNKEIDVTEFDNIDYEKKMLKCKKNGLMLSDEQIDILNRYKINYLNCSTIKELIFLIEDIILDSYENTEELDNLSNQLSEYNYYFYTKK